MSSLYNEFQPQVQPQQPTNPMAQMSNFLSEFSKFRSSFNGNPEQQVKQLLNSGRMSQDQFNQFAQTANQIRQFIK